MNTISKLLLFSKIILHFIIVIFLLYSTSLIDLLTDFGLYFLKLQILFDFKLILGLKKE